MRRPIGKELTRQVQVLLALAAFAATASLAARAQAAPEWVDRPLTLPAGDFAFDVGLGVGHIPGRPEDTNAGFNLEGAVGITSRVELGVRAGIRFGDGYDRSIQPDYYGRLFDRQTFDEGDAVVANPEVRIVGAIVRESIVEVGLEGRVVIPFADGTGAGLLFGVPLAFHLGSIVRLDTGAYLPVTFPPRDDDQVGLNLPLDVWIQAGSRFWLGPMTGLQFGAIGTHHGFTEVSLGIGIGYQITRAIDFKGSFLFPEINDDSRVFGFGVGLQFRVE
jgi:hypothetical protein